MLRSRLWCVRADVVMCCKIYAKCNIKRAEEIKYKRPTRLPQRVSSFQVFLFYFNILIAFPIKFNDILFKYNCRIAL